MLVSNNILRKDALKSEAVYTSRDDYRRTNTTAISSILNTNRLLGVIQEIIPVVRYHGVKPSLNCRAHK